MINFQKLFLNYNISVKNEDRKNIWINANCPHCNDRTYNGGFNSQDEFYHCWRCGHHNLYETLSLMLNVSEKQTFKIVMQYKGSKPINTKYTKNKITNLVLPTNSFTDSERKYLISRNFDPNFLKEKYKIVGGGIVGKWSFRIILPLLINNKVVSWTARSILSKKTLKKLNIPRYLNLSTDESVINPKSTLYNLDNSKNNSVILTEGAFDVLRFGDDCICSFGTSLTQEQLYIIKSKFKQVFILFDDEDEAQHKARIYGQQLSGVGVDVEIIEAYSDFGVNDGAELTDKQVKIIKKELNLLKK